MLTGILTGDKLAVSASVVEAQRVNRIGSTIAAVAAVCVEALPELRAAELVDRLRAVVARAEAATIPAVALPEAQAAPHPGPAPTARTWRDIAADLDGLLTNWRR